MVSHCCFSLQFPNSLITYDVEHIFVCLFAIFFNKASVQIFCLSFLFLFPSPSFLLPSFFLQTHNALFSVSLDCRNVRGKLRTPRRSETAGQPPGPLQRWGETAERGDASAAQGQLCLWASRTGRGSRARIF